MQWRWRGRLTNSRLLTYFSDVTNAGVIFSNDFSTMVGGHNLTAYKGTRTTGGSYQGETTMTDSGTGVFTFGYDSYSHATPTADGSIDGVFLLSPDKNYILGYDISGGVRAFDRTRTA